MRGESRPGSGSVVAVGSRHIEIVGRSDIDDRIKGQLGELARMAQQWLGADGSVDIDIGKPEWRLTASWPDYNIARAEMLEPYFCAVQSGDWPELCSDTQDDQLTLFELNNPAIHDL